MFAIPKVVFFLSICLNVSVCFANITKPNKINHDTKDQKTSITRSTKTTPTTQIIVKKADKVVPDLKTEKNLIYYKVRNNDTLFSVAKKHNSTQAAIIKLNALTGSKLFVGQNIKIPILIKANSSNTIKSGVINKTSLDTQGKNAVSVLQKNPTSLNEADFKNFIWPMHGAIIVKFGQQYGRYRSDGVYLQVTEDSHIKASASGHVVYVGSTIKEYGTVIIIKHPNDFITIYGHNSGVAVKAGEFVQRGQVISHASPTNATKFYFSIRRYGKAYNPAQVIKN